ncbi:MAG: hypothetical protein EOP84_30550 [Verrucomicrobiaceae bacterium]|nr:MAG: hypothetical protein EOP84_30550 [Verrucomicrobiaceae bacterium]
MSRMGLAEQFSEPENWNPAGFRTGWVACSDDFQVAVTLACRRSGELLQQLAVQLEFLGKRISGGNC